MSSIVDNVRKMPGPLKVLTLFSLMSVSLLGATVFLRGVVVGQRKVGFEEWWINGSGLVFAVAICLFFSAGILLLTARRIGRLVYVSGFAGLYVAAYFIELINDVTYSRDDYLYDLLFAALQVVALIAYLFLNRRVRNFLVN
jgi:hypothetical protein